MQANKLRVAFFQYQVPFYRTELFNFLVRNLSNMEIVVYSVKNAEGNYEFTNFILPEITIGRNFWLSPGVRNLVKKHDINILLNDIHWISLFPLLLLKGNARLVLWGQGISNKNNPIGLIFRRLIANQANALLFYDVIRRDIFCNKGQLLSKSFVVPNTLVIHERHDYSEFSGKDIILCIGRLNGNKRTIDLVQAYMSLNIDIRAKYNLVIIGEGEKRQEIQNYILSNNLSSFVQMVGSIYNERILRTFYKRAICSVIPGTVGLGAVHAFAYGVPLLAAINRKHGPEFNYCNNENTFFYDGSIQNLSMVLNELCEDSNATKKKGSNAFKYYTTKLDPQQWLYEFQHALSYLLDL